MPKALLEIDEDFFHSLYVFNKIKRMKKNDKDEFILTWDECLAQYATVGVIGNIPRGYIVSFTILGDKEIIYKDFINENSQYYKEFMKWAEEKGKVS